MAWGRAELNDPPPNRIDLWISGREAGLYDSLLGFNEPDLATQSNMTVDEAIDLWPLLESTDLRLGSPATASVNSEWFVDFMQQADHQNLRVDFVALHRYAGTNPDGLIELLQETYATYQKPIWITEFAVRDGNAGTAEENRWSDDDVYDFMAAVLPQLEELDFVERYCWFPGRRDNPFLTSSALHEMDGQLTRLGRLYKGDVEFLNPSFEAATKQVNHARDWTSFNDVSISQQYSRTGENSLRMSPSIDSGQSLPGIARQEFYPGKDFDLGQRYSIAGWVFHPSSDPLTGTRELTARIQWFDTASQLIGDSRKVWANSETPTDQWQLFKFEDILVPDLPEIAKVRVALFCNNVGATSVNSGSIYVDDLFLNQGDRAYIPGTTGDVNQDGVINLLDIGPFVELLSNGEFQVEADTNFDGAVNLLDIGLFTSLLNGN